MSDAVCDEMLTLPGLSLRVVKQGPKTAIELDGELDLSARQVLLRTIAETFAGRPERVLLDFGRLTFIDSTGVHVAQEANRLAAETGTALTLVPAAPAVQRIFELAEIGRDLPFVMTSRDRVLPQPARGRQTRG
jgi:anti-sigma B factor antagonist